MAQLNFNASEIETSSHDPIPAGNYEAVVAASEMRPVKSGNGMGFNLEFEIISGECKGRKVFAWITFEHRTSPDAQRIGREQLSAICRAVGVTQLNDTAQLHNLPLHIVVALDKNDPTRNIIKGFKAVKSVGAGAAAPQAAPQNQGAPWARR